MVTVGPPVASWPQDELSYPDGTSLRQKADVRAGDIKDLLRAGLTAFGVVDVGHPVRWITGPDVFNFWKLEVLPHLAEPHARARLEDFRDEYFYWASLWVGGGIEPADSGESGGLSVKLVVESLCGGFGGLG